MKVLFSKTFIIHILILTLLTLINTQPQCHISRFPEIIPLQYGQQASINLQQFIWGSNLTFTVQPNDFHSNIQPQYSCKPIWSHFLGKILSTQNYQIRQDNKTEELVAMLGGSSYFSDVYLVYYGINVSEFQMTNNRDKDFRDYRDNKEEGNKDYEKNSFDEIDINALLADDVQVLQVPRQKLKDCKRFLVLSNNTHLQFILDCISLSNPLTKIIATTTIPISQQSATPQWYFIQSPIYLPKQMIPQLNITTHIAVIQTSKTMKYLVRMIMSEYADYIEIWRWNVEGQSKEIVNLYDSRFFVQQEGFDTGDVDLRKWQILSTTVIVLDLMNGLHILQLTNTGRLIYKSTIQIDTFTTFHYDPKQQLLFLAKRGQLQQYQIKILSSTNIKATRIQRYHLYGFQQINEIKLQNRFLYASTNLYIHVIHLTNIKSNDQEYDGSYNVYPELYTQKLIVTNVGFIKVSAFESTVQISVCETHPPFLHLKTPQSSNNFTVNAVSVVNGISTKCTLPLKAMYVLADDDNVYPNGYESQNETIFSNRPGRAIMQLQKYGIGKNLEYGITLFNHQIEFQYKIRKVNNQSCMFSYKASLGNRKDLLKGRLVQKLTASNVTKTFSIGNWLVVEHPQDRIKEYYRCFKYSQIDCKFVQIAIMPTPATAAAYQLIEEEKTKKQSLQQALLYQVANQSVIEVILVSQSIKDDQVLQNERKEQSQVESKENLFLVRSLCRVKLPQGDQYKVEEIKLRGDKLYVVLPHIKQIRIYEALLSFEQNQQCHYFGSISTSSFKHEGIYFAPRHIDFDKHSLGTPFQVPSFAFTKPSSLQLIEESVELIYVIQFNQVIVIRLTIGTEVINRIQLIKEITLDRTNQGNDVEVIITLPYVLAVDRRQKVITQYYFSHTYDKTFIRSYAFWTDNTTDGSVRLVDSNTLAVMAQPDSLNQSYIQVYKLNSIVSSFKQFARWKIQCAFHVMSFIEGEYEFITARLQQTTTLQLVCNSTTLTPSPYVSIQIPKSNINDQPSKQQFYLNMYTNLDSRRQVVTLQVASDSSDIQKGPEYPYRTYRIKIQQDQQQASFEIDDRKWFEGNIWNHRYVCSDCRAGRIKFSDKISLKQHIDLQSFNIPDDFYVKKINHFIDEYIFETVQGYLMTTIVQQNKNQTWLSEDNQLTVLEDNQEQGDNKTYTFSQSLVLSSNIENDPSCIKASPQTHDLYFVSMCQDYQFLDESALIQLRLYSTTGFKPVPIHEYTIQVQQLTALNSFKASTRTQKQLIIKQSSIEQQKNKEYDTLFVRFGDNIWVFLILHGRMELIYTVDQVDFGVGNYLCWMEVIKREVDVQGFGNQDSQGGQKQSNVFEQTMTQYGIIASMCESGLYHMAFTVDTPTKPHLPSAQKQPLPSFHLLTQQQIDMQLQLQKSKIQLPQHAYFLQSIIKPIQNQTQQFLLYMIVSNFNSFVWKVTLLQNSVTIQAMDLVGVIRRYNQYTPVQVTSNDQRYFSVLYKSTQNVNVSEFLAVYDSESFVQNEERVVREYFMFGVEKTNQSPVYGNKSEVFQVKNSLFVLRENEIKIFEANNAIRMHVMKRMNNGTTEQSIIDSKREQIKTRRGQNSLSLTFQPHYQNNYNKQQLSQEGQIPILYSQSIIIFVETPTQVNSVTIKLDSIDYFQLSGWTIALIVIGGLLIIVILYYTLTQLWKYYQKRRKLVKLETQLLEQSSQENNGGRRSSEGLDQMRGINYQRHDRDSQITTSDAPLTQSLIQRYREEINNPTQRQSQIATSDSPFGDSLLEKKHIEQSQEQQ